MTQIKRALRQSEGAPATGDKFWAREEELRRLAGRVSKGTHTLMTGQRRIGKTSLLKELVRLNTETHVGLYLDLEKSVKPEDVIAELAKGMLPHQSLAVQMRERIFSVLRKMPEVSASKGDYALTIRSLLNAGNWSAKGEELFSALARLEKPVILCLDEIPIFVCNLLNAVPEEDAKKRRARAESFLLWLRSMSDEHAGTVCILCCGSIGFTPILERIKLTAAMNTFIPFKVRPWDAETAEECLRALAEHGRFAYEAGAERILVEKLRCCIPHHVQLLYSELSEQCERRGAAIITLADVDAVFDNLLKSGRGDMDFRHYVERLMLTFEPDGQALAHAVLLRAAQDDPLAFEEATALCRESRLPKDDIRVLFKSLMEEGYLEELETGLRFASPLLRLWWLKEYRRSYL